MDINISDNSWQAFALSGNPMVYLDYSREKRIVRERNNENIKSARVSN
jgi:hypothetical protein